MSVQIIKADTLVLPAGVKHYSLEKDEANGVWIFHGSVNSVGTDYVTLFTLPDADFPANTGVTLSGVLNGTDADTFAAVFGSTFTAAASRAGAAAPVIAGAAPGQTSVVRNNISPSPAAFVVIEMSGANLILKMHSGTAGKTVRWKIRLTILFN